MPLPQDLTPEQIVEIATRQADQIAMVDPKLRTETYWLTIAALSGWLPIIKTKQPKHK